MKRVHIAIGIANIDESIDHYSKKILSKPNVIVPGEYAMWRTNILNLSIRKVSEAPGMVRHLGFEEDGIEEFVEEKDINGIVWESFSPEQQHEEILKFWPNAIFQ
jgi:catechol 2,3-dioxygenase-like lactoylglutathione lyase family enzyme